METKLLFSQTKQMLKWRLIQVGHRNQKSLFLGLPNINCYESFWDIKWSWRCFSYLLSKNSSQFDSHCMFLGVLLMEKLSPENVNAWVSLDHFVGIYRRSDYCAGLYCKQESVAENHLLVSAWGVGSRRHHMALYSNYSYLLYWLQLLG